MGGLDNLIVLVADSCHVHNGLSRPKLNIYFFVIHNQNFLSNTKDYSDCLMFGLFVCLVIKLIYVGRHVHNGCHVHNGLFSYVTRGRIRIWEFLVTCWNSPPTPIKKRDIFGFTKRFGLTPCLGYQNFKQICILKEWVNFPLKYQNKFTKPTEHNLSNTGKFSDSKIFFRCQYFLSRIFFL